MWYVYILLCQDGSLYTGITKNVQKRFWQHQTGAASKYTRSHKPIKVVYTEITTNRSEAQKREAEIKQLSKSDKQTLINKQGFLR